MRCLLLAKMDQIFILKKQNIAGKWEKMLEISGNFVSPEKWEPYVNKPLQIQLHVFFSICSEVFCSSWYSMPLSREMAFQKTRLPQDDRTKGYVSPVFLIPHNVTFFECQFNGYVVFV